MADAADRAVDIAGKGSRRGLGNPPSPALDRAHRSDNIPDHECFRQLLVLRLPLVFAAAAAQAQHGFTQAEIEEGGSSTA